MPRARWIKPEFFTDKKVGEMDPMTALVFQALWCWADDGGTAQVDPDMIKSQAFFRWPIFTVQVISKALRELADAKVITVYRVGDDYFGIIRNWKRHQSVHKPGKFRYPRPDEQFTFDGAGNRPETPWTLGGTLPASPPPRILESQTPRVLDGEGTAALSPESGRTPEPPTPPPTPSTDPIPKVGKVAWELSLARELETDTDRIALTALCATVPAPATWVAECRGRLEGLNCPGGKPMTPRQLGDALAEFVGNGHHLETPPSFRLFKRFLETAQNAAIRAPDPEAGASMSNGQKRPTAVSQGEAGSILARLKTHGETEQPTDVRQAVRALGGVDAIRATRPDRWGFLLRDFASALDHARLHPEAMPTPKPSEAPPETESPAMRAAREREEAWLTANPGQPLPADFHFAKRRAT